MGLISLAVRSFSFRIVFFGSVIAVAFGAVVSAQDSAEQRAGSRAHPWLSSNVKGSPDPPLPFVAERVFEGVKLDRPTSVVWNDQSKRWLATQLNGQIVSFPNDPAGASATLLVDMNQFHERKVIRAISIAFHPDQDNQPWCFVSYASTPKETAGIQLVRFRVIDPTVPSIDPSTRTVLATWDSSGHGGGSIKFGPDGYLYLSIGDGQNPYPPDSLGRGQDLSNLQSSILRIDVDDPTPEQPYRIPADNPFVGRKNARGEIWAYGFRNPWKMCFHPETGELFTGDVGWEMREMVYRVKRGANYGWSIMEGSQPVKPGQEPEIPITPPLFEHTHIDSRSITGGFFWQSDRIEELRDAYIYGDWMTGKVWALRNDGDRVLWQKELVDTPLQVICFMSGPSGEVLIVGYDGTIHRLQSNPAIQLQSAQPVFPQRLSETGLFRDVASHAPNPGVIEYEISAHRWADGTHSRQWVAIPGDQQLGIFENPRWDSGDVDGRFDFPIGTVFAKTVSYYTEPGQPGSERHLETQLLHLLDDEWRAYNYRWNDDQGDAVLQADVATDQQLKISDATAPGGSRTQTWHHSSRSECLLCHVWSAGTVTGFAPDQLSLYWKGEPQLANLAREGLFKVPVPDQKPIAAVGDASRSIEDRARGYLALNCSNCHRPQGGGTANFNFDHTKTLAENSYLDAPPAQGDFSISDARVVSPGAPFRSVVLYRTLKTGRGHMPQFGSNVLDQAGIGVLHDWIASLPPVGDIPPGWADQIAALEQSPDFERRLDAILGSTEGALALSFACLNDGLDADARTRVVAAASQHGDPKIRDLFEGFLPEDQRVKRLGTTIDEVALLAMPASADRGRDLFVSAADVSCRNCHQLSGAGNNVGPDLSSLGLIRSPAEILASIVRPSEKIDPDFQTQSVLTVDGNVFTGIVLRQTGDKIVLSDSQAKEVKIPADEIEVIKRAAKSVMPELLLSGMTAQQAADLLAFLGSQRKPLPAKQ